MNVNILDNSELSNIEGGFIQYLIGVIIGDIICNPGDFLQGMEDAANN